MHYREEAGVPADSSEIEVDGVRLAVARDGQGLAVVCLHAIGHGGGDFADFASAVKDRFEVIRIDWPGQGRSGPDPKPLGGLVPASQMSRAFCGAFARFFAAGERRAWWFKPMFRAYYRFMVLPGRAAAKQRERIVNSCYEIAPILREAWAGFAKPDADIRHIAKSLEIRVWFAWSRRDKVIPLLACMPCIRQMKNASVSKFKAGHAAFLEQPQQFVREFLQFAETLGRPR
jgi:pimeloyl-ACP methyl ester carboxylesterase